MAEYDLSKTTIPFLDCCLAFPLLTLLFETSLFPPNEVIAALPRVPTCMTTLHRCSSRFIQGRRSLQVMYLFKSSGANSNVPIAVEFDEKQTNAVSTNERLRLEAQAVLDIIENPDVAYVL